MKRILIVDDNVDYLSYLKKLLRRSNYQVTTINNSKAALEEALDGRYALILLDIQMPELDGHEFLRSFNERSLSNTPIWIITSHSAYSYTKKSYSFGAQNFFPKDTPGKTIVKLIDIFFKTKFKEPSLYRSS